jgi:biotin operon repressor
MQEYLDPNRFDWFCERRLELVLLSQLCAQRAVWSGVDHWTDTEGDGRHPMNVQKAKPQAPPASAQQQAYVFLLEQIQSGRLAGGQRIRLEDVAAELGISRMPIRKAIRQLDTEGLLTIRPNRGAVVTMFSPDHLTELFEMRAVLEGLCARSAATPFTPINHQRAFLCMPD